MKKYEISYDLVKPGKDYTALTDRLGELGAKRIMFSQWVLRSTASAKAIRDDLKRFIDSNDRLLVAGLTGEAAWTSLLRGDESFKQDLAA